MPVETRGAIMRSAPGTWEVVDMLSDDPRAGEIQIKVTACGLCHSDDHIATGDLPAPPEAFPMAGGHEGAGVVEEVGEDTPGRAVGDKVVFHHDALINQPVVNPAAATPSPGRPPSGQAAALTNAQLVGYLEKATALVVATQGRGASIGSGFFVSPDRLLTIAQAYRHGLTTAEIHAACKYDQWFLEEIRKIVAAENEVKQHGLPKDAGRLLIARRMRPRGEDHGRQVRDDLLQGRIGGDGVLPDLEGVTGEVHLGVGVAIENCEPRCGMDVAIQQQRIRVRLLKAVGITVSSLPSGGSVVNAACEQMESADELAIVSRIGEILLQIVGVAP